MEDIEFQSKPEFIKLRMLDAPGGEEPWEDRSKRTRDLYITPSSILHFFAMNKQEKTHTQLVVAGGCYIIEGAAEDIFMKISTSTRGRIKGTVKTEFE